VKDPAGKPVAGSSVRLRSVSNTVVAAMATQADGRYEFAGVPSGAFALETSASGFAPREAALRLAPGEHATVDVQLSLSPVLSEVTVSAEAGQAATVTAVAQRLNIIPAHVIEERSATVLSEAAEAEPGVAQLKTSSSLGAIFVRGLTGKNVSVYRDGVRYTTSAQRGGISTFLNLNDPAAIESMEILRGPNSAVYGSDSLGGSVNLVSRVAEAAAAGHSFHGSFAPFFASATNAFGGALNTAWSAKRLGLASTLTARRVNTARTAGGLDSHAAVTRFLGLPSNVLGDRLPDTAFTQYGGTLHAQLRLAESQLLSAHYERAQQDGGKRYDQLLGGDGNLIADLRNLMLDFGYLRYHSFRALRFDELTVTSSYNAQREERVNQGGQGNPDGGITHQYEKLQSNGLAFQALRQAGRHAVALGGESYWERLTAPAFTVNPVTGASVVSRPRVPGGARYLSYGLYVQDVWTPFASEKLRLSSALRFGGAGYRSRGGSLWPDDSLSANAVTGRAGAVYAPHSAVALHAQYSRGFRPPNMTDLGTLGLTGNGFEATYSSLAGRGAMIGDRADDKAVSSGMAAQQVRPESTDNVDYGVEVHTRRFSADVTGFWLRLNDSLVSQTLILPQGAAGQFLGGETILRQLPSGAVFVAAASNPVLVRGNYDGAILKGLEQRLRLQLTPSLHLNQNFTLLRSGAKLTSAPPEIEPGTPPSSGSISLLWAPGAKRFWVEAYGNFAERQNRLPSIALTDRRTGAPRSRANIASFFANGARVRGLVVNNRLIATGETLEQVQARVLGTAASAPLFTAIPGYAVWGLRGGVPLGVRSQLALDFSNIADKPYRGIGWGMDGLGRALTLRYRVLF
jgi:outer membrane receptor protein involved in Fe transport